MMDLLPLVECPQSLFMLQNFLPFIKNYLFIYLFIYLLGCVGSSFLCEGFLQLRQAGATLHRGARASHYRGLSCCRAQAPDAQAQQLWPTGPVAPWHVGSSQTRARTRVPCISRQTLNHCATREARLFFFFKSFIGVQLIYNVVLVLGVQQSESVIHIHISTLFQILFPHRPLQSIEQSFLCYTVGPYQLSILLM